MVRAAPTRCSGRAPRGDAGGGAASRPRTSPSSRVQPSASTRAGNGNRSARGTTPSLRLTAARIRSPSARTYSVLPPPMSNTTTRPSRRPSPDRPPRSMSRASSSPLTTSTPRPVARSAGRVERHRGGRLLALQRPDIVDDRPALVLFEHVLPGRHHATAVRDLPEELAIGLLLHPLGGPVRGLGRRQRRGRGTVAVTARAVTRHAVDLDELLRVVDALDGVLHLLRLGRRDPRPLRRGHRGAPDDEGDSGDRGHHRPPERAHGASSRPPMTFTTKPQPFNTPVTKRVKPVFVGTRPARRAPRASRSRRARRRP